jgi:hypothetical protein
MKNGAYMNSNQPICGTPRGPENLPADYGCFVSTQTGALLVALGSLLMNLYPFREHVDPRTGEMLVKIGRKLTGG